MWRAYSSIMWVRTQRSVNFHPPRSPVASSDGAAAVRARELPHSASHPAKAPATSAVSTRQAASQSSPGAYRPAISSPASSGRNQFFSTSAMCRTMPRSDSAEGGTACSRS